MFLFACKRFVLFDENCSNNLIYITTTPIIEKGLTTWNLNSGSFHASFTWYLKQVLPSKLLISLVFVTSATKALYYTVVNLLKKSLTENFIFSGVLVIPVLLKIQHEESACGNTLLPTLQWSGYLEYVLVYIKELFWKLAVFHFSSSWAIMVIYLRYLIALIFW